MPQIGVSLVPIPNRIRPRHARQAEARNLWKDVPDPVAALASRPNLLQRRLELAARVLRLDEAFDLRHHSFYDAGHEGATASAVTELLDGETLADVVPRGPLQIRKAIEYGMQIARALAAAHDRGIVHRDLKPANVIVTRDGHVKVLDFGLARTAPAATDGATTAHTAPGLVMGTVGYMAPEQARGLPVDHRADVFAFGCLIYELIAGKRAFDRGSAADTLSAILREDPPPLSTQALAVPLALERVVQRCLEKDPGERFQSARDVAFALDALSSGATGPTSGPIPVPSRKWWPRAVVGVVQDVYDNGVNEPLPATVYWPALAESSARPGQLNVERTVTFAIRSPQAGSESLLRQLRAAVWSKNASLSLAAERTMQDIYEASMARTSFTLVMLAIAGAMALLLGVVGIYGVLSYAVSQRTREIGIRLALGAQRGELSRMFLRQALLLTGAGTALGLAVAAALSRMMSSLLYATSPLDPPTLIAVPIVLVSAALLASYLPARRAAAVDPVLALKN